MATAVAPVATAPEQSPSNVPLYAIEAELCRRSLAWFVRTSWRVLEPTTPLVWGWHIQAVCDHVQALLEHRLAKQNLIVSIPPRSMKSRVVSVCTTPWMWLHNATWRAIYSSGNPRVSLRDSMYARDLIESQWYQQMFRPKWKLADDQNAKGHYRNTERGERRAISSGAAVTGDGGDALFVDDAIDAADAHSKPVRDGVVYWYDNAYANRVNDPLSAVRCVIGQRLHQGDLTGHILANEPDEWEHLCIRQEYEAPKQGETKPVTSIGWTDPRTNDGELMDPERFPAKVLQAEKRRLGSSGYAGQHQQRPASAEGNIVKRDWLRFYTTPAGDSKAIIAALGITQLVQGWDTALTENQSSDYTAGVTLGIAQSRFYVLDLYKQKVQFPDAKKAVVTNHAKWGANAVPVEAKSSASGKAAVQEIRRETRVPVIEVAAIDKVVGLNKVAPTIEANVVYLPEDAPWVADFIESLCTFPQAIHDDDVDAFRIALDYAINGGAGVGMLEWLRRQSEAAKGGDTKPEIGPKAA